MSLGTRRIVAAALLAVASLYAGSQTNPAVAVSTLGLSAACGAALMWFVIKRHLWGGKPRSAGQMTTLYAVGAVFAIFADNLLEVVWGASARWVFFAVLAGLFVGVLSAVRLSPYGDKELE